MKIPITMCHGASQTLTIERLENFFTIAKELGFSSINYDDLEKWHGRDEKLSVQPIMFDFDHPIKNIYDQIFPSHDKVRIHRKSIC